MLTLITGVPGTGKTAELVRLMQELAAGRPLFVDGVNGLKLEHTPIDARQWHKVVPTGIGAVIGVDEGQRLWRPRGSGSKVPDEIQAMEVHRHGGSDIFITTQHPKLLDGNLKILIGRHVHIRDLGILGRWWYEWPECSPECAWKTAPIKRKHKLPKSVFSLYVSSSLHVKPIRSFPVMLAVLAAAIVLVGVLSWMAYRAIAARLAPTKAADAPAAVSQGVALPPGSVVPSGVHSGAPRPAYVADRSAFIPRWSSDPGSAPAFDELRRVVAVPRVVGGWCRGEVCRCIDQQGRSAGLSSRDCRSWLENPPFDPYWLANRGVDSANQGTQKFNQVEGKL